MTTSALRRAIVGLVALGASSSLAAASCQATLPGANVAGGEFNGGKANARAFFDYVYPGPTEIALLQRLGLKLMRVPFLWERLQPKPAAPLDAAELARLDHVVDLARAAHLTVVLDVHNYGTYGGVSLDKPTAPPDALPDLWARIARHYGGDSSVVFGLMNEPKDVGVDAWAAIAKSTVAAIRTTGAKNVVLVPGTAWDGAHSWFDGAPGHSNADALLAIAAGDPATVFEVHQYFDADFSGTGETCGGSERAVEALAKVGAWARAHRVRVMLGEFGVSRRPECVQALDRALGKIEHDQDVWYGWTYWAAGAWWGDYPFSIQPATGEAPQAGTLRTRAARLGREGCGS